MQVILSDGTTLDAIMVVGNPVYVQGASRDSLTFVFDDSVSMDEIDALFSETNCESIHIIGEQKLLEEDGTITTVQEEDTHKGYVIRTSLTKKQEVVQQGTAESPEEAVTRIQVTMAQRSYAESQMAAIQASNEEVILAVAEMIGGEI